jgi:hypothetical protein
MHRTYPLRHAQLGSSCLWQSDCARVDPAHWGHTKTMLRGFGAAADSLPCCGCQVLDVAQWGSIGPRRTACNPVASDTCMPTACVVPGKQQTARKPEHQHPLSTTRGGASQITIHKVSFSAMLTTLKLHSRSALFTQPIYLGHIATLCTPHITN